MRGLSVYGLWGQVLRRVPKSPSPKPKPKAPPVDTMIVTIPEGSQPGDELSFTAPSGQEGSTTDLATRI